MLTLALRFRGTLKYRVCVTRRALLPSSWDELLGKDCCGGNSPSVAGARVSTFLASTIFFLFLNILSALWRFDIFLAASGTFA